MISVISKSFKDNLAIPKIYILGFLISLFFSYRHTFLYKTAYITGTYSDFTSFSLYLSDIFIFFGFFVYFLPNLSQIWHKLMPTPLKVFVFWLLIGTLLHLNSPYLSLNLWISLKFIGLMVSYGTFAYLFSKHQVFGLFMKAFVWFCAFESVIAVLQFAKQSSLGLYRLGESHIAPNIIGAAKIVSGGTTYIRGYGTFPHPNLLSAFLVTGILLTIWLLINSQTLKSRIIYSTLLFLNILALTVAFSRGAYMALSFGLIVFFGFLFWRQAVNLIKLPLLITAVSILISFLIFKPFILTRATLSDQATIERNEYNRAGLEIIKNQPLSGVGLGESVLHMEDAMGKNLAPWQKQPVHNYFLLASAELGIPGALILIWVFLYHLKSLWLRIKDKSLGIEIHLLLFAILMGFIVLMNFDHYFYTLQQTQILLWIILAIATSEMNHGAASSGVVSVHLNGVIPSVPRAGIQIFSTWIPDIFHSPEKFRDDTKRDDQLATTLRA